MFKIENRQKNICFIKNLSYIFFTIHFMFVVLKVLNLKIVYNILTNVKKIKLF